MKEVRYNDRIWFGKHKGMRFCELIKHDPNFIQKMVLDGKIKLDAKTMMVFEQNYGRMKKPIPQARPNFFDNNEPGDRIEPPHLAQLQKYIQRFVFQDLPGMQTNLAFMFRQIYRNENYPGQYLDLLAQKFFIKVKNLNFIVENIYEFMIIKNENLPRDNGGLKLYVMDNGHNEMGHFDIT